MREVGATVVNGNVLLRPYFLDFAILRERGQRQQPEILEIVDCNDEVLEIDNFCICVRHLQWRLTFDGRQVTLQHNHAAIGKTQFDISLLQNALGTGERKGKCNLVPRLHTNSDPLACPRHESNGRSLSELSPRSVEGTGIDGGCNLQGRSTTNITPADRCADIGYRGACRGCGRAVPALTRGDGGAIRRVGSHDQAPCRRRARARRRSCPLAPTSKLSAGLSGAQSRQAQLIHRMM